MYMFYFEYEWLAQKILFTCSERRRVRKVIETSNKPVLKENFLSKFLSRGRHMQHMSAQSECV